MADIILPTYTTPTLTQPNLNLYPTILAQFTPPAEPAINPEDKPIECATVGTNRIVLSPEERDQVVLNSPGGVHPAFGLPRGDHPTSGLTKHRTFEPVKLGRTTGPLIIHGKRWYFRLVTAKEGELRRARALMDDFSLNEISHHMVVCFTPDYLPGQTRPFRTKEGDPVRIYAFFDSYLEFYEYMQKFQPTERAFYEIIFGELPQKPHFDIDVDRDSCNAMFPGEDIDVIAETLREMVIMGCISVLSDKGVNLDLSRDLLLYSSHGPNKRSYHIVINNKCHDGNKEARAFYDAVMVKVHLYTQDKYRSCNFIDKGVYSPRQQFRLVGCQKYGSNRPKVFYEQFWYKGEQYTHIYNEDVTDITMKKLTIIYESMISFTSGCAFVPSLVVPKPVNHNNLGEMPDLDNSIVDQCLDMLRNKMNPCPFVKRDVQGHLILLTRKAPSHCPICQRPEPHMKEHPYMFIVDGKVYWDCRRSPEDAKKFFVGYLAMSVEDIQAGVTAPEEYVADATDTPEEGFMFGDYNIGAPTLVPKSTITPAKPPTPEPTVALRPIIADIPPDRRMQNVPSRLMQIATDWARKKYIRQEAEDLTGVRSLDGVTIAWTAGLR